MVIEAHGGGLGRTARRVLDTIAKHVAASGSDDAEAAFLRIAQRLSITLHENARAVLRRLRTVDEEDAPADLCIDTPPLW